jgi:hypothetical protein
VVHVYATAKKNGNDIMPRPRKHNKYLGVTWIEAQNNRPGYYKAMLRRGPITLQKRFEDQVAAARWVNEHYLILHPGADPPNLLPPQS